jgi:hypothetical protein
LVLAKTVKGGYIYVMNDKTLKNGNVCSFFNGFMSVFDISGQTFISVPNFDSGFQQDREAIRGDWQRVGDDIRRAMNIVIHEQ